MLHELGVGGLLFSPLLAMVPVALLLAYLTRLLLYKLDWRRYIWKEAWFDVGLFVCFLALTVFWWR
ncbi:DUF1656 domain-containing protein [Pseudomaricurvus sp.]|uniref:DUF1656 domain-containing protein n=1 Tax=Pseudomaricurvus sp. TaxID=2004510 RepID=UPI003F6C3A97